MLVRVRDWILRHRIWFAVIAIVLAGLVYFIFSPSQPTYEYVTQTVDRGSVVRQVTASGKLRALNTIKVGAEVSGQITRVNVDFNSTVYAGQVLAEIDPTRLRARVAQAQAAEALAQASLSEAEANAARARSELVIQEREFGRRQSLADQGFVSKSALDSASSVVSSARAAIRTTAAQGARGRAQIAQARAELSAAQLDLRRATIIAPASGVIINKLVEPGATVAASFQTPNLFEIAADTTRMQVEASVDEADIGQVRDGQPVRFTVDSYPDERFRAVVRQIRKAATETQNVVSYIVVLDVDNKDGRLLPGMTANVEIITGQKANVVRVPTAALRFRPRATDLPKGAARTTKPTIWLAGTDPRKPAAREIAIGLQGEEFTEVTHGVAPPAKIVVRSRSLKKAIPNESEDGDGGGGS